MPRRTLLSPREVVRTQRLRLSLAAPGDVAGHPWLAAALAPEWQTADLMHHAEAGDVVLISGLDGRSIGVAVCLAGSPSLGVACIPWLAIEPRERFRGQGGEAALAVERLLRARRAATRVLAPVPEGRGLAVYFWLRLGYRPLIQTEAPWPLPGLAGKAMAGIWMARDAP